MKKDILHSIGFCLLLLYSVLAQCQTYKYPNSVEVLELWKDATIKNINYQLSLKQVKQRDSFFAKVLINARQFITVQSRDNGLRKSFFNEVLKQSDVFLQSNHAYIVEHYRSGEGFKAIISIYSLAPQNKQYTYELGLGQWKLIESKDVTSNAIASLYTNTSKYFCDDYYTEESIIVTCFKGKELASKALFFPCSEDFKEIRQTAFLRY